MMDTSVDGSKKVPLEDLPKEEVVKKYRAALGILQKAKQSQNSLTEENERLKSQIEKQDVPNAAAEKIIEKLIQQKLALVTSLDDVRSQKELIQNKLKQCELSLKHAEEKVVELDTENQGHQRQVNRLTEENDQLLNHLDDLGKQTEELKKIGLEQKQQLLELEKQNDISIELFENAKIIEVLKVECDSIKKNNENLLQENNELTRKNNELLAGIESLTTQYNDAQGVINNLTGSMQDKVKQNETYLNTTDDLNIELHKNKALVEKLQQDIVTMTKKLKTNQIESSCIESDLLNNNEKLKEKLQVFRSKIIKFAGDVKLLKMEKGEVLNTFRNYVEQAKLWEIQLKEFADKVLDRFEEFEKEKQFIKGEVDLFKSQFQEAEDKNIELSKNNEKLVVTLEELKLKLETLENEKVEVVPDNGAIEELQECKKQIEELRCKLIEQQNLLKEENDKAHSELKILQDQQVLEKNCLTAEIESLKREQQEQWKSQELEIQNLTDKNISELKNLTLSYEDKLKDLTSYVEHNQCLVAENEGLQKTILELKSNCDVQNQKIEDLENQLISLKSSADKLMNESVTKLNENEKLEELSKDFVNQIANLNENLTKAKNESTELLNEMNEMNQVLKERGETISKQQEYCEELLKSAKMHESQNKKLMETIREKEELIVKLEQSLSSLKDSSENQATSNFNEMHDTLDKKNEEVHQLQNELTSLREKLLSFETSHDTSYAESETMSTSTISKTEEMSRIKDLEGSWEEKYVKLRNLALKLKGKIRDLTGELSKEQNEKADIQQKLANSLKTIQTLQMQCDKLQDQLDLDKNTIKDYSKKLQTAALDISKCKKQLAGNDELITKFKNDIEVLNKEKSNVENWKKQVSGKIQNLVKELDANNVLKKDFENQISKLNAQLESKEKSLKDEIEKHNTTKNSLQEINNEFKKQSLLNLEIQDYERSLKDLTQKLEKKQELITKLKDQIDNQRGSINTTKEQNRVMEDRIQLAENDLTSARNEIQICKKSIADLETVILQKDEKIQNLTHTLEVCRTENEDLSMQLSKIVSDNQKVHSSLKNEKDYLVTQNLALEQKVREIEDNTKLKEDELRHMSVEYQNYKVRAQSVFRQNQTRDIGLEEKLTEEVGSFKAQLEILQHNIIELKATLKQSNEENVKLRLEKEQIENKIRDLEHKYEDYKSQFESLSNKHQKTILENAETTRSLKVHSETLAQCYRQQISEQEVRHNREVIELQSKIEKVAPLPDVPQFSPTTVAREQGEGSENIENISLNTQPVPLDRLLSGEPDADVGFIKKQVIENETKVAHLTALLADTEQDLAKHVQMNKLLKEEIRRQQRSVEREKHAENLEYLKNVVFKFATLSSGDERFRLVPVLNTILKFSPEETNKLNLVAKGDLNNRGWANYLPAWPTAGKPQ